jgi:ribosomal-protein-alanine N-acetyltransferase
MALERQSPTAAHWPESFYSRMFEDGETDRILLVAEEGGVLLGFLVARKIGDECELESIVVAEAGRHRGVGSKLIGALIGSGRDRKINRIFLEVRESNGIARSFYEACGFSMAGRRNSYYNDPPEDAVLYTLTV